MSCPGIRPPNPAQPEWATPRFSTVAAALERAERSAGQLGEAHVVIASVADGELRFEVILARSYARLREEGRHTSIAPVASVLPNGQTEIYRVIQPQE